MSAYDSFGKYIICPFYNGVSRSNAVQCEGPVNFSRSIIRFENSTELNRFINKYCCDEPGLCPICKGLSEVKYASCTPPPPDTGILDVPRTQREK